MTRRAIALAPHQCHPSAQAEAGLSVVVGQDHLCSGRRKEKRTSSQETSSVGLFNAFQRHFLADGLNGRLKKTLAVFTGRLWSREGEGRPPALKPKERGQWCGRPTGSQGVVTKRSASSRQGERQRGGTRSASSRERQAEEISLRG